ncbi:RNA-binding protein PNO1 [Paragonimus westermani]|uniref:RNA-binding protein PNO1 n=1 Tax=Paragonimus westermani TaxID=34504 RepID=A0A5J4P0R7_9TREM|nr:RNA-binding protein PNO1 [Paragonimus westermani]
MSNDEVRTLIVPTTRRTPLRSIWSSMVEVLTKQLKLMVCLSTRTKAWRIFLKTSPETKDPIHLQKGYDFVHAFLKGFKYEDALAVVRIDGIYVESFHIMDVKQTLKGDHMARAVGRICGAKGRIRMCVENATRTRIVVADETIHILGSNERIAVARRSICDLILGAPPNKIFGKIRTHAARLDAAL